MAVEPVRRPGRPRSEDARHAVLTATLELAAESGPAGLTMGGIAERAGVSKETLYRWWHSKTEVVLEALAHYGDEAIPVPDTGSLAKDLRIFMRATSKALDHRTRQLLLALAAQSATDPTFADQVREEFIARRRAALAEVLERAVKRGELAPARAAVTVDFVFGSLWYRLIFGVGSLDRAWADAVADSVAGSTAEP